MIQYCRDYSEISWRECGYPNNKVIFCEGHKQGEKLDNQGYIMKSKGIDH